MSSAGRAASSSGCVGRPRGRETGLTGYAEQIQRSWPTGSSAMETAEHREPYESRGSRTDLGAPGGESPPGDSTNTIIPLIPIRELDSRPSLTHCASGDAFAPKAAILAWICGRRRSELETTATPRLHKTPAHCPTLAPAAQRPPRHPRVRPFDAEPE